MNNNKILRCGDGTETAVGFWEGVSKSLGFPGCSVVKNPPANAGDSR